MYAIHAHLKAHQTAEWLIVMAIALIGSALFDDIVGLIVGAVVGYLGILAWHKGTFGNRRGPPDEPRA